MEAGWLAYSNNFVINVSMTKSYNFHNIVLNLLNWVWKFAFGKLHSVMFRIQKSDTSIKCEIIGLKRKEQRWSLEMCHIHWLDNCVFFAVLFINYFIQLSSWFCLYIFSYLIIYMLRAYLLFMYFLCFPLRKKQFILNAVLPWSQQQQTSSVRNTALCSSIIVSWSIYGWEASWNLYVA